MIIRDEYLQFPAFSGGNNRKFRANEERAADAKKQAKQARNFFHLQKMTNWRLNAPNVPQNILWEITAKASNPK